MGKDSIPKNWPIGVPYLAQPSFSPHVTKEQHASLKIRSSDLSTTIPAHFPRGPSSLVKIIPIQDPSHPANGQAGLFAAKHLESGILILPYYGVVHTSMPPHSLAHEKSDYDLWLDREANVAVDAAKAGNEARFVNDYRGISQRPNAEFKECWDARIGQKCSKAFIDFLSSSSAFSISRNSDSPTSTKTYL
ncbi:hypothetical protein F5Y16DRAFT_381277 [Xylariaceae sp. FL0255]|nr:hypothetical protein F5Y16DRAFT_381277 [Xylariaceae sp. FL0255]